MFRAINRIIIIILLIALAFFVLYSTLQDEIALNKFLIKEQAEQKDKCLKKIWF
jgi:hypothetical protein